MTKPLDEKVIGEVYKILVKSDKIDWPSYFTNTIKLGFLERMLEEYQDREDFSKCDKMRALIDKVKLEENNVNTNH